MRTARNSQEKGREMKRKNEIIIAVTSSYLREKSREGNMYMYALWGSRKRTMFVAVFCRSENPRTGLFLRSSTSRPIDSRSGVFLLSGRKVNSLRGRCKRRPGSGKGVSCHSGDLRFKLSEQRAGRRAAESLVTSPSSSPSINIHYWLRYGRFK